MTTIERIETHRLILREHTLEDFDALHAMWSEPAVCRHIIGRPSTREEAWSRLLRYSGHWRLLGYGYWAVEERVTGDFVGEMGRRLPP
jgi:RimJ/RimL family protein N-acetyltransferase